MSVEPVLMRALGSISGGAVQVTAILAGLDEAKAGGRKGVLCAQCAKGRRASRAALAGMDVANTAWEFVVQAAWTE